MQTLHILQLNPASETLFRLRRTRLRHFLMYLQAFALSSITSQILKTSIL